MGKIKDSTNAIYTGKKVREIPDRQLICFKILSLVKYSKDLNN